MKRHQKLNISIGPFRGEATGPLAIVALVVIAVLVLL